MIGNPASVWLSEIARDNWLLPLASICKPIIQQSWWKFWPWSKVSYWPQEMHLSQVIFKADALSVIQAINDNSTRNEFGHIIQEIQQARHSFARCFFKHVCRDFNKVARDLPQFARLSESTHLWKGVTPPFVLPLIQADLL